MFVGGFIGTPPMNFLRVTAGDRGRVRVGDAELDAPRLDGHDGELLLGIRAEHLEVTRDQAGGSLPAQVQVVEPIGSQLLVTSTTGDQVLKLLTPTDFQVAPATGSGSAPTWTASAGSTGTTAPGWPRHARAGPAPSRRERMRAWSNPMSWRRPAATWSCAA
jgi:ABC-type sugar transport system ATPase subunit